MLVITRGYICDSISTSQPSPADLPDVDSQILPDPVEPRKPATKGPLDHHDHSDAMPQVTHGWGTRTERYIVHVYVFDLFMRLFIYPSIDLFVHIHIYIIVYIYIHMHSFIPRT